MLKVVVQVVPRVEGKLAPWQGANKSSGCCLNSLMEGGTEETEESRNLEPNVESLVDESGLYAIVLSSVFYEGAVEDTTHSRFIISHRTVRFHPKP